MLLAETLEWLDEVPTMPVTEFELSPLHAQKAATTSAAPQSFFIGIPSSEIGQTRPWVKVAPGQGRDKETGPAKPPW